jgi:hypothetical protein
VPHNYHVIVVAIPASPIGNSMLSNIPSRWHSKISAEAKYSGCNMEKIKLKNVFFISILPPLRGHPHNSRPPKGMSSTCSCGQTYVAHSAGGDKGTIQFFKMSKVRAF